MICQEKVLSIEFVACDANVDSNTGNWDTSISILINNLPVLSLFIPFEPVFQFYVTEGVFRAHLLALEKENSQANGVS